MSFHNPYHFVPVKSERRNDYLERKKFCENGHHVAHDRYLDKTYSGRLICRLTTQSPIFIGAKREEGVNDQTPATAEPFELPGEEGRPAIPATSLRGLVSSLAEAASNSALRVLEARPYSYRMMMDKGLSAVGMVLMRSDENGEMKPRLLPLTLPTIPFNEGNSVVLPAPFRHQHFLRPNLKVFIGNKDSIRQADFPDTFRCDDQKFYGMKLVRRTWGQNGQLELDDYLNIKGGTRDKFLVAQKAIDGKDPIPWDEIPEGEMGDYTRGIIRSLGCYDRDDMPNTKKHELFIPFPDEIDEDRLLSITDEAIKRFYDLADHRTEADPRLPYEPKGTVRNSAPENDEDRKIRLKDGDLVFFEPVPLRDQVAKISFSSIWRDRVEVTEQNQKRGATAHTFFRKVNEELLPFNADRKWITIAEQMFGFVQQEKDRDRKGALALAGRVWFSHARWQEEEGKSPYQESVTLRILDAPKPPSPAFYFKKATGRPGHIAKSSLSPGAHLPQGRKFYLHRSRRDGNEPWRTANPEERAKQKVTIKPICPQSVFYFHADFSNLSKVELGLLLYALQPSEDFRHKIGMGKSIGLGTVRIEHVGLFLVDRAKRYSPDGLFAPRHATAWIASDGEPDHWPEEYALEKAAASDAEMEDLQSIREAFTDTLDPDIGHALELIGNPDYLKTRVHTPLIRDGEKEDKTFRWFVANDHGSGNKKEEKLDPAYKHLSPLSKESNGLPQLEALEWRGE